MVFRIRKYEYETRGSHSRHLVETKFSGGLYSFPSKDMPHNHVFEILHLKLSPFIYQHIYHYNDRAFLSEEYMKDLPNMVFYIGDLSLDDTIFLFNALEPVLGFSDDAIVAFYNSNKDRTIIFGDVCKEYTEMDTEDLIDRYGNHDEIHEDGDCSYLVARLQEETEILQLENGNYLIKHFEQDEE